MNQEYKEIYDKLITDKWNNIIIEYLPEQKSFRYQGYSHQISASSLDDVVSLVIDNMVFYAFSENEVLELNEDFNILDNLREAASSEICLYSTITSKIKCKY